MLGGLDRAAITAHLAEAGIVQHDEQDVGRAFLARWAPARPAGDVERPSDDAVEGSAWLCTLLVPLSSLQVYGLGGSISGFVKCVKEYRGEMGECVIQFRLKRKE